MQMKLSRLLRLMQGGEIKGFPQDRLLLEEITTFVDRDTDALFAAMRLDLDSLFTIFILRAAELAHAAEKPQAVWDGMVKELQTLIDASVHKVHSAMVKGEMTDV